LKLLVCRKPSNDCNGGGFRPSGPIARSCLSGSGEPRGIGRAGTGQNGGLRTGRLGSREHTEGDPTRLCHRWCHLRGRSALGRHAVDSGTVDGEVRSSVL
jgi:hypothetical protein